MRHAGQSAGRPARDVTGPGLAQEALITVMHGRTTILISHRVSTVRSADRIFVIEYGRVAEQGTHAELIERGGYYADLYQKQLLEEELEAI